MKVGNVGSFPKNFSPLGGHWKVKVGNVLWVKVGDLSWVKVGNVIMDVHFSENNLHGFLGTKRTTMLVGNDIGSHH